MNAKKNSKQNLVYGVGFNDSNTPVTTHKFVNGASRISWVCPFYIAWRGMFERCYSSKYQAKRPTYTGCTVSTEWHSFSAFREWMETQPWEGNQIDKDIIYPGNRAYGAEFCVFVPARLNLFVIDCGASRGEWPIGVNRHNPSGKFQALISNPFTGKRENIGLFDNPDNAHQAWRARKYELACIYADQQKDPRIADALRNRYSIGETKWT